MIVQLNKAKSKSGLGRYVDLVAQINYPGAKLYNLIYDKYTKMRDTFPAGTTINGVFPFVSSGWKFNSVFQNLIYKLPDDAVYHYLMHTFKPFRRDKNDLVTIHDAYVLERENKYRNSWEKATAKNFEKYKEFDNVITDSQTVSDQLRRFGFDNEITTIHIPADPIINFELSKKLRDENIGKKEFAGKRLLISVSGNGPNKNLPMMKAVIDALPDDCFLIRVGDSIGSQKEITYSEIDYIRLLELYSVSDALLFPSTNEGYGIPQVEAISMGIPVLAYDLPVSHELLGDSALYATTKDQFVENAIDMLENREYYARKARERAGEFQFDKFSSRMSRIYQKIEKNKGLV